MKVGERSLNMTRAFNAREGFTRAEDKLPPKLFQPLTGGRSDGVAVTEEEMAAALPTYYAMCGWDPEGRPTRVKLEELGLAWVADELSL
jgi:aldehyde:ferredoxin oxidoreductase